MRMSSNEEQAYLEKWKQLQKYVEPLKRMINKIDKDEGSVCVEFFACESILYLYFCLVSNLKYDLV